MKKLKPYKLLVFLGSAMAATALPMWLEFRLQNTCGACVQKSPLWVLVVLAMAGIVSTTQYLWYLFVEK